MIVDMEANAMKRKNSVPQSRPNAMWLNTFGSATKSRFGPLEGLTP